MFGTVARYVVKPGHEKQLMDEMGSFEDNPPPGWLYHTVFRSSKDPNEIWLTVVFESEEAYRKNADSPDIILERSITITSRQSNRPLEIRNIQTTVPGLKVTIETIETNKEFELTASLSQPES